MNEHTRRPPPTREQVLAYLEENPNQGSKREIARALRISGDDRVILREILSELEAEGALARTGKRDFQPVDAPPPTGIVAFERVDAEGDLIGRCVGRDGLYGPDILFAGTMGKGRQIAMGIGERALCRISKSADGVWKARALNKIEVIAETTLVGLYRAKPHGGGIVEPTSRKEKNDFIVEKHDAKDATEGDLVRIRQKPGKGYGPRRAEVIEVIGRFDDPRSASLIALHTHGVPDEFPQSVLDEAQTVKPLQATREDLTRIPLITIDPEDARDHDDAVWAEPHNKGWKVIVAIADVAAYVRPGSILDREAYRRGNSTYFPDRVAPMLPEHLSADLCSLKEGELRETLAVEMIFAADGRKIGHRFIRGRMRSAAKLSYRQAQDAIDGHPDDKTGPLLENVLKPLWAAYEGVDKARKYREPLELDLPERRVRITEDGKIGSITMRDRFDAHKLIEEFMIQANVCAAETLEEKRSPLVYRVHEQPSDEKLAALGIFLPTVGLNWAKGQPPTGARFNRILAEIRGTENEGLVNEMILRSQSQARYAHENLGHFGLNLPKYAHFTSPIRRYSDLIVHRGLITALGFGPDGARGEDLVRLEEQAEHVTMTERRSMAAEREAIDRYLVIFMADKVGAVFPGRIAGVTRAGLFVKLKETGADGFCPAARLSDEYWIYDEAHAALVGQRSGKRYEMGMDVDVKLLEATPLTGGLLFEMETPPRGARKDLGMPRMNAGRPGRPGPKMKRAPDGGGRPPGVKHSRKKGQASYGKNKKKKR
jgi:ribonuclease R